MQKCRQKSNSIKIKQPKADLVEIFSSHQGEGLFIGARQIFIRFAGCNLNCCFCDTMKDAVIKDATVTQVVTKVKDLEKNHNSHHSISLTGGEPLLCTDFLEYLLPELKKENFKIYLETNGTLVEELKRIIGYVDIIAMDIKLPSSSGSLPLWGRHIKFLEIARKRNIFIKAVVTNATSQDDIMKAGDLIAGFDKEMLLVLQPAGPTEKGDFTVKKEKILHYRALAEEKLRNVRIIPQTQKFIGIQ